MKKLEKKKNDQNLVLEGGREQFLNYFKETWFQKKWSTRSVAYFYRTIENFLERLNSKTVHKAKYL